MLDTLAVLSCALGALAAGLRWLRVAQREHYLADSASRFFVRWWLGTPANAALLAVAAVATFLSARWAAAAFATAAVVAVGPFGMGLRGRTAPLNWTRRLRTLAAVWVVLQAIIIVVGVAVGRAPLLAAAGATGCAVLVDLACALTAPAERALANRFVERATQRLRRVAPRVVAITGSYGKTSTKGYVAHLASLRFSVVASPASFNNRAGLARAVNENLADGTDVFVAEMGTYGPGEIAELCSWMRPDIAVITALGPVHLERFGTEEAIVAAKSEILGPAAIAVIEVDDPRLSALADRRREAGAEVWRVSTTDASAEVFVSGGTVSARGQVVGSAPDEAQPGNVGCAVAVALALGVEARSVGAALAGLPVAAHRLQASRPDDGSFVVLDDTYNANPAGAAAALAALEHLATAEGRRVVITPGLIELGRRQRHENEQLARSVVEAGAELVVVGRTNRRALLRGAAGAVTPVRCVADRDEAVAWARLHLSQGDVALYENDLPDHYP